MTVLQAVQWASARILRRDAETLLLHVLGYGVLGYGRAWLLAHPEADVEAQHLAAFAGLTERRARHEPLQYLTGEQEFYGLRFAVTPDVLIPRPETELLVEAVLEWGERAGAGSPALRILDVGTGSGAIVLALAAHLPAAALWGVDVSRAALEVAAGNARALALAERVRFHESDLLKRFLGEGDAARSFDVVVSNPPYVPLRDAAGMQSEVRDFEPHLALFAGEEGSAVYRRLIPQAWEVLCSGGLLAMEFGFGQREALRGMLAGWEAVRFLEDYAGIPRVVLAERP